MGELSWMCLIPHCALYLFIRAYASPITDCDFDNQNNHY